MEPKEYDFNEKNMNGTKRIRMEPKIMNVTKTI
jgi:hypothetical protein